MQLERILVVDDESIIQKILGDLFRRKRFTVTTASSISEAEAYLAADTFDLVMLDVRLPDGDGQHLLERIMGLPEKPLVVMMTGHGTIESAVNCMRTGAFDYLIKPFSPSQIEIILKKGETFRQLMSVNRYFSEQNGEDGEIVGRSPALQRLRQLIMRVAPTDATVLITGENGTGKEMVARSLWKSSSRRNEPYIKVNCASLSENLIESELFGHEKGSFTGATNRREGRFELANRGTLLLDEVSEISPNLQAKLLRVLQEREFERVGGTKTIKVNVRILATSNRDLLQFVERGSFRSDLYYRLNVFPVHVPPLRERPEDIMVLGDSFLQRFAKKHGLKTPGFSDAARQAMQTYPWPGNVRELQNTVERAVILAEDGHPVAASSLGLPTLTRASTLVNVAIPVSGSPALSSPETTSLSTPPVPAAEVQPPPLANPIPFPASQPSAPEPTWDDVADESPASAMAEAFAASEPAPIIPLDELERKAIIAALEATGGNRTRAAEQLNISIRTLRNKLQEYRSKGLFDDSAINSEA